MRKIFLLSIALLGLFSCESLKEEFQPVFTLKYNQPEKQSPAQKTANCTIAELVGRYNNAPVTIKENLIISGVVSTTDKPGNFYKSFYIQDETGGMEIKIGKNSLYNDYLPGQRLYINCKDLCIGMYGYKSGKNYGQGIVNLGFQDPTGEYETSYIENALLIDAHIFKGEVGELVEPVVVPENKLPGSNDTQVTNHNIGKLVTIQNLTYGWLDKNYNEMNKAFALLYIDSNKDKKASSNRIFVTGEETGISTWAMSKMKMAEYLYKGIWDSVKIGNGNDYSYGTVGDRKGDGTYPEIEKAAASVSQYFSTPNGTCIQIRTSGFCKFSDVEMDHEVLSGNKTIDVTGILALYQGKIQIVVNNIDDIKVN